MGFVRLWNLYTGRDVGILPEVDVWSSGGCADGVIDSQEPVDALVLLEQSYREALVRLGSVSQIALDHGA